MMKRPKEPDAVPSKKSKRASETNSPPNEETKNDIITLKQSTDSQNAEKDDKDFDRYIAVCEQHGIQLKRQLDTTHFASVYYGTISRESYKKISAGIVSESEDEDIYEVAVKIPKVAISQQMINQEIAVMKRLDDNAVGGYFVEYIEEIHGIVMQYMSGGTLDKLLESKLPDQKDITRIARDIAKKMAQIHVENIIHRDLRCCNILFDKKGRVKISGFGMLKYHPHSEDHEYAKIRFAGGQPLSTEPELNNQNEFSYGKSFDVLYFGIMLWKMIEGKTPEELNTDLLKGCHPVFKKIIGMCVEKDPVKRCHFPEILAILELHELSYSELSSLKSSVGNFEMRYSDLKTLKQLYDQQKSVKILLPYFALDEEYTSWIMEVIISALRDPTQSHIQIIEMLKARQIHNYADKPGKILECLLSSTPCEPNIVKSVHAFLTEAVHFGEEELESKNKWLGMLEQGAKNSTPEYLIKTARDIIVHCAIIETESLLYVSAFEALTFLECWEPSLIVSAIRILQRKKNVGYKYSAYQYLLGFNAQTLQPFIGDLMPCLKSDLDSAWCGLPATNLIHKLTSPPPSKAYSWHSVL